MATLRGYIDGTGIIAATSKDERDDKDDSVVHHLKKAAVAKVKYDVAKANLASKMAPMQHMTQLVQQMHGPNPQDPNDPFQNPYQQQGEDGPGGVGQGMENQDDLSRTGAMKKPMPGGVDNYMKKGPMGNQPGKPQDDGNKRLQTPDSRMAQGKPQQRSTSGNKPPGKQTQPTEGKPVKKAKKIKLEISDDKMSAEAIKNGMKRCKTCKNFFNPVHPKAGKRHCPDCKQGSMQAYGTSDSVKKAWDTRGRRGPSPRPAQGSREVERAYGKTPVGRNRPMDELRRLSTTVTDKGAMGFLKRNQKAFESSRPYQRDADPVGLIKRGVKALAETTRRGKKVKTTGDYHDNAGVSMPTVGIGLSATRKKMKAFGRNEHQEIGKRNFPPRGF